MVAGSVPRASTLSICAQPAARSVRRRRSSGVSPQIRAGSAPLRRSSHATDAALVGVPTIAPPSPPSRAGWKGAQGNTALRAGLASAVRRGRRPMFRVGHLSDLHATPVRLRSPRELHGKRLLGWLSWHVRRSRVHRPDVLDALIEDLQRVAPDQIVVTGDLTNVACEQEFVAARAWLHRIGKPERVSIVPGNHDAYAPIARERSWDHWSEFLRSDPLPGADAAQGGFPTLRVRGAAAFVGLSSAEPTALGLATGTLGEAQLARLEAMLAGLADSAPVSDPVDPPSADPRRRLGSPLAHATRTRCAPCCAARGSIWSCTDTATGR